MAENRPLDGIVTGHETRFDFPEFTGAPRPYLFASVPRSGSSYVSHLMWRTGCLGAPLEYMNFAPTGPLGAMHGSRAAQEESWQHVLRTRTSPNGVFGMKAFPAQMEDLGRLNPPLLGKVMRFFLADGAESRVIQLRRRDRTAHAISLARASLSGVWRREQESAGSSEPDYSPEMMERARTSIEAQESAWLAMYRDLGIAPLVLWYEDVREDETAALEAVAAYLGVALDPACAVDIPMVERQSQAGARAWQARYAKDG